MKFGIYDKKAEIILSSKTVDMRNLYCRPDGTVHECRWIEFPHGTCSYDMINVSHQYSVVLSKD